MRGCSLKGRLGVTPNLPSWAGAALLEQVQVGPCSTGTAGWENPWLVSTSGQRNEACSAVKEDGGFLQQQVVV